MRLWLLLLLGPLASCDDRPDTVIDLDTVDDSDWIDPNDPTRGMDLSHLKAGPSSSLAPGDAAGRGSGAAAVRTDASLKRILNGLFHELQVDPGQETGFARRATLRMDAVRLERVAAFLAAAAVNDWAAHERLCADLEGMIEVEDDDLISDDGWSIDNLMGTVQPYIAMANVFVLLPAAFVVLRMLIGTRSVVLAAFWCFFAFSLYTTYDRKYKEEVSARLEASALYSDTCRPPTFLQSSMDYLKGFVSIRQKSDCRRFIESQQKSIISEIQLTEVLADVIFNSIFAAIPILGTKLKEFFLNFYGDMPPHIAVISTVLLLVFIFFWSDYSLRSILVSLEPGNRGGGGQSAITATVSSVAAAAAQALLPDDAPPPLAAAPAPALTQPPPYPDLQPLQQPQPYRRPARLQIAPENMPSPQNRETNRDPSRERGENSMRDSWVTDRSPQRRSRMSIRQEQGELKYRSISLPREHN